jgi:hypothetical protein
MWCSRSGNSRKVRKWHLIGGANYTQGKSKYQSLGQTELISFGTLTGEGKHYTTKTGKNMIFMIHSVPVKILEALRIVQKPCRKCILHKNNTNTWPVTMQNR